MRQRLLLLALAASVGLAVLPMLLAPADAPSPHATAASLRGEVHVALRALLTAVDRADDPPLARAFTPLRALIARRGRPPAPGTSREAIAGPWFGPEPAPPTPGSARELAAAEERLAGHIARIGAPLPDALLAQIGDRRADAGVRALVMRVMAVRWPGETASAILPVLAREPRLIPFAEAATLAGQLAAARVDDRLVDSLRGAVARTRGWGRQYPIAALVVAGDRDSAALVVAALDDGEVAVRRHAALYLAAGGHMRCLARLDRMSRRDPDGTTRRVMQHAVAQLVGIRLAGGTEAERREQLDAALVPRLAMFRETVHR